MNAKVVAIIIILTVIVACVSFYFGTQKYEDSLEPQLPMVTTVLENYGLKILEIKDFSRTSGFSASLTFIKFETPESFAEFCLSKNVTTVMHYYGNMRGYLPNYHNFFFLEGETAYRYIIE
jgi:hypothetical protein